MKKILGIILALCIITICTSCEQNNTKADQYEISQYEEKNKEWLSSVHSVTEGKELFMQPDLQWNMSKNQLLDVVKGPYYNDSENFVGVVSETALPMSGQWKVDANTVNSDDFEKTAVKAYYVLENGLIEYGYMVYSTTLNQYDFLKELYTKKYGSPAKEEFIWNDSQYTPTGDEDYYDMFLKGQLKVLTLWDIEELETVLVLDWLADPVKYDNDYGQISFYKRSSDFDVKNYIKEN